MSKRKSVQNRKNENQSKWFLYGALVSLSLVLTSCVGPRRSRLRDEFRTAQQAELEARLIDVPLPIGTTLKCTDIADGSYILRASIQLPASEVIAHFISELERSGWNRSASCRGNMLSTYIFNKPHKTCVIHVETTQESPVKSSLVLSYIMQSTRF